MLSILGLLLAAQQIAVLQLLGKPPTQADRGYSEKEVVRRFLPLMLTEVRTQGRAQTLYVTETPSENGDHDGKWSLYGSAPLCFYPTLSASS